MRSGEFALTAVAFAAAILQSAVTAEAQGGVCLELESRLAAIERSANDPGAAANRGEYEAPVAQQRNEIGRAMAEARRAGCTGGFLIFQRRAEPKCPVLMATIDRMRANLQRLMSERGQSGDDPFALARERNEIMRSLAFNRCGPAYATNDALQPQRPGGLFQALFGQPLFREDGFANGAGFGTFRTLCVRSCDGYYFPISFSTVPAKFNDDAMTCQQMCPGSDAALYTHRNPGEDTTAMVSLAGQPYATLPTAYLYRKQYDRACSCRSATATSPAAFQNFSPVGSLDTRPAIGQTIATGVVAPVPRLRPAPGEDPETAANRAGALVPKMVTKPDEAEVADIVAEGGRRVRIVGPPSYYAQ